MAHEFVGSDVGDGFCEWLFLRKHENYVIIFHSSMSYDGMFIMQYLLKQCSSKSDNQGTQGYVN